MASKMSIPTGTPLTSPMAENDVSGSAALAQLRAYIVDRAVKPGERLPPERVLCADLGLNRAELRRALEVLEGENRIWRHVGKGTS